MITPVVSESEWMGRLTGLPALGAGPQTTVVIAPHPDDETLGAGGLIAVLRSRGIEVTIVAVTDGENAYSDAPGLAALREREQTEALARLGVDSESHPSIEIALTAMSRTMNHDLTECLLSIVPPNSQIVAPWRHDFHPDHEACGRVAEIVAKRQHASLASYFFWTWHRGVPETLAGLPLVSLSLGPAERCAKREALLCHQSQLQHENGDPILPENLLEPAWRSFEVFLPA